jgi:cell division protein FtsL
MGEKLMPIEIQFEKRIMNNNVIREADARSQRDYIIITALAAMFLLGLFGYGWQHYKWIQYGYRIEEAQKKKEQLSEIAHRLRLERAALRSPQRIDSIARGELGMVAPAPGQMIQFSADAPLTIPAPRPVEDAEAQPAALTAKR